MRIYIYMYVYIYIYLYLLEARQAPGLSRLAFEVERLRNAQRVVGAQALILILWDFLLAST